jgi:hypothetical protein
MAIKRLMFSDLQSFMHTRCVRSPNEVERMAKRRERGRAIRARRDHGLRRSDGLSLPDKNVAIIQRIWLASQKIRIKINTSYDD